MRLIPMPALLLLACAHHDQEPPEEPPTALSVSDLVAYAVELHTSVRLLDGVGPLPSHGLVVYAPDALVLVDTAWGAPATAALLAQVDARHHRRPDAAILTHSHDDRAGGLRVLQDAGIPVYATAQTAALLVARGETAPDHTLAVPVDSLQIGGVTVETYYPGPAHTQDNLVVWIPASHVLFGGCMVRPADADTLGNTADADLLGWAGAVARVGARYPDAWQVVPSHGAPGGEELLLHTLGLAGGR